MATLWRFLLPIPSWHCLQSGKGPAVFSLDGSMAALAGRHPSVQAGAECRAVRSGSCWEGVDFPGDMVSSLIIVRLPFPVPDPISEAEREQYPTLQDYIRLSLSRICR